MKRIFFALFLLGVALLLISCGRVETGGITILSPAPKLIRHDDLTEMGITVPLTVESSFAEDKVGMVLVGGEYRGDCLVSANTISNCPPLNLYQKGIYEVTVVVTRNDGSQVKASQMFEWTPYTPVDKLLGTVGGGNPTLGYVIAVAVIEVIFMLLVMSMTKGSTGGVIFGFFGGMILLALALYAVDSTGAALAVANGIFGIIGLGFVIFLLRGLKLGANVGGNFVGVAFDGSDQVAQTALNAGRQVQGQIAQGSGLPELPRMDDIGRLMLETRVRSGERIEDILDAETLDDSRIPSPLGPVRRGLFRNRR